MTETLTHSPRVNMSKRRNWDEDKFKPKEYKSAKQSTNYTTAGTLTPHQLRQLYQKWNQKLTDSGFNDIEYHTYYNGNPLESYFKPSSSGFSSSSTIATTFKQETLEYYLTCEQYWHACNWKKKYRIGKTTRAGLYKYIFLLHANGLSYRDILKCLNNQKLEIHKFKAPPPNSKIIQKRSILWIYYHLQKIIKDMWAWKAAQEPLVELVEGGTD